MNAFAAAADLRHCVECGKPIVHRRMTALYCSGKCRESYNARKRRQARYEMQARPDMNDAAPPMCVPEAEA
jgi:predicted nucleic acid-binding Zn ribbon protein